MARYEKQSFTNQEVILDGNQYIGCVFNRCVLVFSGGGLPTLERCTFNSTRIQLDGAAQETLSYLGILSKAGLYANVGGVVTNIKKGVLPIPSRPQPCDPRDTGSNYRQLGAVAGVLAVITLVLIAALWYGFLYHPNQNILGGEIQRPLEAQIPLELMPVLPDNLAAAYDTHLDNQSVTLDSYGWTDEENGIARIPIEAAFEIILEDGPPIWPASGG